MARTLDDYQRGIRAATQAGDTEAADFLQNEAQKMITGEGSFMEKMGAGMMDIVHGTKQLFGQSSPEQIKEHNRIAGNAAGDSLGGKLTRGLGSATLLAPAALIPGVGTVGGAALVGAGTGLLEPTEDENVISGKAKNAAIGGLTGGVLQGGINLAAPVVKSALSKTMDTIRPAFAGGRQQLAEKAFVESIPEAERAAAEATLRGAAGARQPPMAASTSGAPVTSGAALGGATPQGQPMSEGARAILAAEREAREAGGNLGHPFRAMDESAAQARWGHLQQNVGGDLPALTNAAEAVENAFKQSAKMKAPFDANDKLGQQISGAYNRTHNQTIKAELERIFQQYQSARAAGDVTSLHELRMTAFDDALGRLYQTDKNASKLLRNTVEEFKTTFDKQMNRSMGGGKWSQYLTEYGEAASAREQGRAGNELLKRFETLNETPGGVPTLTGQQRTMAREAAALDDYGKPVLSDPARDALTTVRKEINNQMLPTSAAVGPRGSATAQNLNPSNRVLAKAIEAMKAKPFGIGDMVAAGVGTGVGTAVGAPVLGTVGGLALKSAGRKFVGNNAINVAERMLQLHTDPMRAAEAIAKSAMPPSAKSAAIAKVMEFAQAGMRGAPAAGAATATQGGYEGEQ